MALSVPQFLDDIPEDLFVHIVSNLARDDLHRSLGVVRRIFYERSTGVSVDLFCPLDLYTNPLRQREIIPFKEIIERFILNLRIVHSLSIRVDVPANHRFRLSRTLDNLDMTDTVFLNSWLPEVGQSLLSLSVWSFSRHSRRNWSHALSLICSYCPKLEKLELKNAWLKTVGLRVMSNLTSLALASIKMSDEGLEEVNRCCRFLKSLSLELVEGIKNPRVNLLHLKTCQFAGSGTADSLSIEAPKLVEFKFKAGRISKLQMDAPLLSDLRSSVDNVVCYGNILNRQFQITIPGDASDETVKNGMRMVMGGLPHTYPIYVLGPRLRFGPDLVRVTLLKWTRYEWLRLVAREELNEKGPYADSPTILSSLSDPNAFFRN